MSQITVETNCTHGVSIRINKNNKNRILITQLVLYIHRILQNDAVIFTGII